MIALYVYLLSSYLFMAGVLAHDWDEYNGKYRLEMVIGFLCSPIYAPFVLGYNASK